MNSTHEHGCAIQIEIAVVIEDHTIEWKKNINGESKFDLEQKYGL